MGSYRLNGVYRDPTTGDRHGPGDVIELDDKEAHRLRFMLTDPDAPEPEKTAEPETPKAHHPRARKASEG